MRTERYITAIRMCLLVAGAGAALFGEWGCAIHYYDADTGVTHLIGVGHMKMKVTGPDEGVRAAITSVDTLGISAGSSQYGKHLSAGWHRTQELAAIDADTSVCFEWMDSSPFSVRAGNKPPDEEKTGMFQEQPDGIEAQGAENE